MADDLDAEKDKPLAGQPAPPAGRQAGAAQPQAQPAGKSTVNFAQPRSRARREEVILEPKGESSISRLNALQSAGFKLAVSVGFVIAVITVYVVWAALQNVAELPNIPAGATAADISALTQAYQARATLTWGPAAVFDTVVVKSLLPVFTLILGYIFGSSTRPEPG